MDAVVEPVLDVSSIALGCFFQSLKRKDIPAERLLEYSDRTYQYLTKRSNNISWNEFVRLFYGFIEIVGKENYVDEVANNGVVNEKLSLFSKIGKSLTSLPMVYWAMANIFGPRIYKCVKFNYKSTGKNSVVMSISIDENQKALPELLDVYVDIFKNIAELYGISCPDIVMEKESDRKASYVITNLQKNSIWGKIFRWRLFFRGVTAGLAILKEQNDELLSNYHELQERHQIEKADLERIINDKTKVISEVARRNGVFVKMLSHDMKNQLCIIGHYVDILQETKINEIDESVNKIENARQSLSNFVQEVSELEILNAMQSKSELKKVNLKKALSDSINSYKERALNKKIKIRIKDNFTGANPFVAANNNTLCYSVFGNFISNAIKFSNEGDMIHCFINQEGPESVSISIRDYGVGIKGTDLLNLFNPDVIKTTRGTNNEKGTGLGMPIVHDIVTSIGGSVSVDSISSEDDSISHGTTFTITLPLYFEDEEIIEPEKGKHPYMSKNNF